MKTRFMKAASLSLYLSIWAGFIVVGHFLGLGLFDSQIMTLASDPINGTITLILSALSNPLFLGITIFGTLLIGGLTGLFTGSSFAILFIIPMAMVVALLQLFVLPTQLLLDPAIPDPIRFFYVMFIGFLTLLTIMEYTSGRR